MKYLILSVLILILSFDGFAQSDKTRLKIYAACPYEKEVTGEQIQVTFTVDKSRCDPEIGFISMDEKIYIFQDAMKEIDIDFKDFNRVLYGRSNGNNEIQNWHFEGSNEEIERIVKLSDERGFHLKNWNAVYGKRTLEDQDEYAICALKHTQEQAKRIAAKLGYKNCDLIGIDDDSSVVGFGNTQYLFQQFDFTNPSTFMSRGAYSIIGHFEVY